MLSVHVSGFPLQTEALNICGVPPLTDTEIDAVCDEIVAGLRTDMTERAVLEVDALDDGIVRVNVMFRVPLAGEPPAGELPPPPNAELPPPPPQAVSANAKTTAAQTRRRRPNTVHSPISRRRGDPSPRSTA